MTPLEVNHRLQALISDFVYLVTALLESPSLRWIIRRWSAVRYRTSGTFYHRHVAWNGDYGAALSEALDDVPGSPARILDVSTGTGHAARTAMARFPQACVYGCDLSLSMLSEAHANLQSTPLICCDSAHLPFGDGVFDLVLLQNAPPPLRELTRVTAPGGWMILGFSAAGLLPGWLPEQVVRRLGMYGVKNIRWNRVGRGLYIAGQIDPLEDGA